MDSRQNRLDPDAILEVVKKGEAERHSGRLRIFLGMSAGVGKTYAMLKAAHQRQSEGARVLVGLVETHGRSETAALLNGLEIVPRVKRLYRSADLEEMDLEGILAKKPDLVIVDELAHSNVPGSRHSKRYQDVIEILEAGIDVYTALNVQHLESRKDSIEQITGIRVHETVPDALLERASVIELVDIAPEELLKRLREGKVYLGEKAESAAQNFFKEDKLTALREIALRLTAERVDHDLQKLIVTRDAKPWQTNERLLVAVSHSPHSEKVIRAGRRVSASLNAPWIAVHVDTGIVLSEKDQLQLHKNIRLAGELGADVIMLADADLVAAMQVICRQRNVTQILVGRPVRKTLRDWIEGGALLSRLVRDNLDVDIHVVRQEGAEQSTFSWWSELLRYRTKTGFMQYYSVLWFLSAVTFVGALLEGSLGYRAVGFLFLLAVLVVGVWGSIGAVLFSAVVSALVWNFGFIPPRFTFIISSADDLILCLSYFLVALITGILTQRIRLRERLIRLREEKTSQMNLVLEILASGESLPDMLAQLEGQLSLALGGEVLVLLRSPKGQLDFSELERLRLGHEKERAVAEWSFRNSRWAGWSTETLSEASALFIPLRGTSDQSGLLVFRPLERERHFKLADRELLVTIAKQIGLSIERELFRRQALETQRLQDSEILHQTLLNSISHEMRTPLTTIMGASSWIESHSEKHKELREVARSLSESSERLNRVIENLLDMSRLTSGVLALKLEWHDPSDLIGVVLQKLSRNLQGHEVQLNISERLGLVRIDFRLLEHALSNVILNAAQYGGDRCQIKVIAECDSQKWRFKVQDSGPGISPEHAHLLFQKFYRVPGTPAGGTGLGLSIVKGVVELHKGELRFEPPSTFVLEFPLEVPPALPTESENE